VASATPDWQSGVAEATLASNNGGRPPLGVASHPLPLFKVFINFILIFFKNKSNSLLLFF
jgi:hypothetical protein